MGAILRISMYGPESPRHVVDLNAEGTLDVRDMPAFDVSADTLGIAIQKYQDRFSVAMEPYDGRFESIQFKPGEPPRYFLYTNARWQGMLMDISIERGAEHLQPEQDLNFGLQDGDIIEIVAVAC